MTTTVQKNKAHRNDIAWEKVAVDQGAKVPGHWFTSEYRNLFTGQTIRKSGRMQGCDWFVFDAVGNVVTRAGSLTYAKWLAEQ